MTLTKHDHVTFSKYTDRIPAFLIPPQTAPRGSVRDQEVRRRKENQQELQEIRTYDHLFEIMAVFFKSLIKNKTSDSVWSSEFQSEDQKLKSRKETKTPLFCRTAGGRQPIKWQNTQPVVQSDGALLPETEPEWMKGHTEGQCFPTGDQREPELRTGTHWELQKVTVW